ncbi:hypothetical protein AB0299_21785 [Pseudarthrobacter sp. NPDC080037]|uniref:hypothetical protein n=1 Tax=Pseudarthrobacter sp. NPDC080037 TaxID=3155289 RepID=UPI00344E5B79
MRPLPAFGVVLMTAVAWVRAATPANPSGAVMTERELFTILSDSRGPEMILSSLTIEKLSELLDALYRNLDTPMPVPDAIFWYEMGVEESHRRNL